MTRPASGWSKAEIAATACLAVVCVVLAAVAYGEIRTPFGEPDAVPPSTTSHSTDAETREDVTLPPLSRFSEVTARPLFLQSRRGSADDGGGSAAFTELSLAGLIVTPDTRQALISHGDPAEVVSRREGQSVDGWLVMSIRPDRVIVRNGAEEHELRMVKPAERDQSPDAGPGADDDNDVDAGFLPERSHARGR